MNVIKWATKRLLQFSSNPATCVEGDIGYNTTTHLPVVATAANTWSNIDTGTGDVVGPGSSTDNAIVRFDGTTGLLVQNSAVTIADTTGNMAGVGSIAASATGANVLDLTAATDVTGIKLTNSSQSPIFDIYTSNVNASARNHRITTNYNSFGMFEILMSASQGAAPTVSVFKINGSGDTNIPTTDEATSATNAAFTVAGGVGINKKLFVTGDVALTTKLVTYNNIATAGLGTAPLYAAPAQSATKTGNFTVLSYTPPSTAGTYRVGGVITTTSSTNTGTVQFTLDYVDSQGTTHTADIIPLLDASGVSATTKTGASKEFHAQGWSFTINNSGAAIVLKVVITGSVSYTVTGSIEQMN